MPVKTKQHGQDVIMRHDYDTNIEKINSYRDESYDYLMKFLHNCPKFMHGFVAKNAHFLDVGCGDAYIVKKARADGFNAHGIDLYIEENKEDNNNIIKMDWNNLAERFSPEFFSVVFINHSLEHAQNISNLIAQISKIHALGGILFIAVPDANFQWAYKLTQSTTHWSILNEGFLNTMLQRFGYQVEIEKKQLRDGKGELFAVGIKRWNP